MIEQFVSADRMSCLFNEDIRAEVYPEPFRMQPSVVFRVTYLEYSKYILSLSEDSGITLMANLAMLRNLASNGNPKLYRYYLADMAFAMGKEIFFAECYKRGASVILPATNGAKADKLSDYQAAYQHCNNCEAELRDKLQTSGFQLPKSFRDHNGALFQTAVVLYYLSKLTELAKEVNLAYDL